MKSIENHGIVVVGGGICGLATALALHRKGIKSLVLERSETLRATGAAIIMLPNGWTALNHLQVADALRNTAILINKSYRVYEDGKREEMPKGDGEVRCLKRQDLVHVLANNLPPGTVRYNSRVVSLKVEQSSTIIHLHDGHAIRANVVVGCDGVHSVVSNEVGLSPMKVTNTSVVRGFTEYPNGHGFSPELLIHTYGHGQLGHIPITQNSVYWFITRLSHPEDDRIMGDPKQIHQLALDFMKGRENQLIELVEKTDLNMLKITTTLIIRSPFDLLRNKFRKNAVTVSGDALHAMGPFLAQGGSLSLEDAVVLARCIAPCVVAGEDGTLVEKGVDLALDHFFKLRQFRAFWIMVHTFLMGVIGGTIPNKFGKYVSILLLALLFGGDPSSHSRYDCGPL